MTKSDVTKWGRIEGFLAGWGSWYEV